ncbi:MAG: restriction endonuclease subunit S [Prevotella sp.]|nr:restriction endonuclease subunit S [Prevotella sp.]
MSYQVPQHISKNKIFIVNRSEIEGRLDPKMALYNRKVQNWSYPKVRLKDLLLGKPQYGAAESGITRTDIKSPRYIRITDIDEYGLISHNDLGATANTIEDQYILHKNDLLIARSGATVGKAYIHKDCPYTCFFAGYLIRFVINPQIALPDYVFAFTQTNTYKEWVSAVQRPSGQPNINSEEYQSLEIPLPPTNIQNEIVSIIQTAYSKKQEKESEAKKLLESIDTFILNEIGVSLPEYNTTLKDRTFIINRKSLDSRWDPYYSQQYFRDAFAALESCKYPIVNLKKIAKLITSGVTPKSGGDAYTKDKENGVPFVRSGNISIEGELDFDDLLYLNPEIHETLMCSSQLQKNDILIAIVGATIGQVGIYPYDGEANINQAIALVRLKDGYNVQFIKELIKSSIGQLSLNRLKRPVARANINLEEISTIKVVLPPLDKQQEIAEHIADIRKKARALQEEGKDILEQAKREVERMILQ